MPASLADALKARAAAEHIPTSALVRRIVARGGEPRRARDDRGPGRGDRAEGPARVRLRVVSTPSFRDWLGSTDSA
ncbi:hypothetical protein [Frankia sp. AgB32]|uniref:hypothetical protein n=1 Tax=Frankia sp. AgB32 TaxID=631119 RepID=UPI00200EFE78|nr:hypothetical protein [Frankia sp. AgB32]MCK9897940.1 hypothetical protein [Frankia sp. AgB32]